MSKTKMFLFARWISINYSGVLNEKSGEWWKKQLLYFTKEVYRNYKKNGTIASTKEFLKI